MACTCLTSGCAVSGQRGYGTGALPLCACVGGADWRTSEPGCRLSAEIGFAHKSFKWRNNAAHVAGVTCVIVGIRRRGPGRKTLYSGDLARTVKNIGPYLLEMGDIIVSKESSPINGLPKMEKGNMPTDDGNFILSPEQKDDLLQAYPQSAKIIRRYYGSQEFIKGIERWCLWIADDEREFAESIPPIKARLPTLKNNDLACLLPHNWRAPAQPADHPLPAVLVPA